MTAHPADFVPFDDLPAPTGATTPRSWTPPAAARSDLGLIFAIVGLILLLLLNRYLNLQILSPFSILIGIAGIGTWTLAVLRDRAAPEPGISAELRLRVRFTFLVPAVVLTWIAFDQATGNLFRPVGVYSWFVSMILWFLAWWPTPFRAPKLGAATGNGFDLGVTQRRLLAAPLITLAAAVIIGAGIRYPILLLAVFWFLPWDAFSRPSAGESWWRVQSIQKTARVAAVLAVLALGGWFRFHDLDVIPSDPTSDHAEKLLDITDVLNGDYHVFFPRNTGREAIQFYLTAFGLVRLLDMEPVYYTVKVSIALLDTLAVLAVFLLARELGGYAVGLSASFLFATNAWAVSVGRFGLRPAIGALTAALTIGLLLRYLRTGHLRDALLCGASIGFGLYGYSAFRTVPIAVAGILLLAFLIDPRQRGRRLRLAEDGVVMALTAVVFLAPLLRFITEEWSTFWYRTSTRTTSAEVDIAGEPWRIFLDNNLKMLKPFNWQGMDTIIQFVVGVPLLDVITGALLLAGTILLIIWAVRERSLRYATPLLIFPVLALSSTLSIAFPNEVPSSTRSALLSPFILTAAAMPIGLVLRQAFTSLAPATARALMMVSAVVFFGVVGYVNYDRYFVTYRDQFLLSALPTMDISRSISTALDAGVPIDNVYLANVPYWIDNRVIGFELQDLGWAESHNIAPEMTLPLVPVDQPSFYVLNPTDVDRIALLEREYPDAVVTRYEGDYENRFYVTIWNPGSPPQE